MNFNEPIEIEKNIFWLGFPDFEAGFSNNPYLLYVKNESILFDPGPGYPLFKDILLEKIKKICKPEEIRYIIVHHQDPDLCGLIPLIENFLSPNLIIISHSRTSLFLPYYGIKKPIANVSDNDILILNNNRKIRFIFTPYVHFAGSMMTYDEETKTLFSSDVFAILDKNWKLYATKEDLPKAKLFLESYVEGKESILFTYKKLKNLEIKKILPQHGSIIQEDLVSQFIELLTKLEPGRLLRLSKDTKNNLSNEVLQEIKNYLEEQIHSKVEADTVEEMCQIASQHSHTAIVNLIDFIINLENKYAIQILTSNKIHNYESLRKRSFNSQELLNKIIMGFTKSNSTITFKKSKNAIKQNLVVMFFDIRKFTVWSQFKEPSQIFDMLNQELGIASEIIQKFNGRINKIMGDGILAYFTEDYLNDSVISSIKIQNLIYKNQLLPAGISLDYGEVIIGDIGLEEKIDYSLIGSTVNSASRLNEITEKGKISISLKAFEKLNDSLKNKILQNPHLVKDTFIAKKDEAPIEYLKFTVIKYNE